MKPTVRKIYSQNSDFQYIETLRRNRVKRSRAGEFFVEGVRSIEQALRHNWQINALVFSREKRLSDWAEKVIGTAHVRTHYELTAALMAAVSLKEEPSEIIALAAIPADDVRRIRLSDNPLVLALDRPILPGNIGTVIRSCDALHVDGVMLTGHSADLYDPETIRAATGSFFAVPSVRLASSKELAAWVDEQKAAGMALQVVGTSAKSTTPIDAFDFTRPTVLVAGNETHGLSENFRALCDAMVTIPMAGSASSLNLASATSIMLYEIDRQRRKHAASPV